LFSLFNFKGKTDKSSSFYSLDDIYYFGGQSDHNQIAILNHKSVNDLEINLKIGDIIGLFVRRIKFNLNFKLKY
jgi:hypothetical protein